MRREGEVLHYGLGDIASLAARCRSSGHYCTASRLEQYYGERRFWDGSGRTMFATFPSPWLMDHSRRCDDRETYQAFEGWAG